jgi:hypothetical protein
MPIRTAARLRRHRAVAIAFAAASAFTTHIAAAQVARRDSSRTDSTRAQRLERVMISAVRGSGEAPISQKTLSSADLQPRYFGQDVPLLLQGAAPSLTSYAPRPGITGGTVTSGSGASTNRASISRSTEFR